MPLNLNAIKIYLLCILLKIPCDSYKFDFYLQIKYKEL